MNRLRTTLGAVTALLIPAPLFAHEGHGFAGTIESVLHWLSSPYHLVILAAVVAVAIAIPLGIRRLAERSRDDVERWG